MQTRFYADRDFRECVKMFYDIFSEPPFNYTWLKIESASRYFRDMARTPGFCAFVAVDDKNAVLGACFGVINDYFIDTYYDIKEIFVSRRRQGLGIGSAFIADIEALLKNRGVDSVSLSTDKKIEAYNFYKKRGFNKSDSSVYMFKKL